MKNKALLSLLIIIAVTLIGSCDVIGGMDLTDLNRGYSFNAEIMYEKETTRGSFTRNSEGKWEGIMTDPYALQGIGVAYDGGEVNMNLGDFAFTAADEFNLAPRLMLGSFENAVLKDNVNISSNKDCVEVKGNIGDDEYIMTFTKHNNIPISLEIPKKKLKVIFTEAVVGDFKSSNQLFSDDDIIADD